jgi:hypothetical protein
MRKFKWYYALESGKLNRRFYWYCNEQFDIAEIFVKNNICPSECYRILCTVYRQKAVYIQKMILNLKVFNIRAKFSVLRLANLQKTITAHELNHIWNIVNYKLLSLLFIKRKIFLSCINHIYLFQVWFEIRPTVFLSAFMCCRQFYSCVC